MTESGVPSSTYRLQIRESFDLDAASAVTGYLRDLGVEWAYLSPLLRASKGSDHGYDVVDTTEVDPARGGRDGLDRFVSAARAAALGILVDIVPNHMGVAVPRENAPWWSVLREGRDSAHASWFDIDAAVAGGRVILPILGAPLDEVLGDIRIDLTPEDAAPDGTLHYFDHVLPLAPGSATDGDDLSTPEAVRAVLDRQHYELRFWRDEATDLNYRRFFAVTTLAGVRVEVPEVFDATHREILRWIAEGLADGLRVDHPDGLRDPGAYLDRLDAAMRAARPDVEPYVLVEKILEHGEQLPSWWHTAGTTGYDALAEFDRVLVDPTGEAPLNALDARLRAATDLAAPLTWHDLIHDTKRMIADTIQVAEIRRLVRSLPSEVRADDAADAVAELLACFPVYRSYLPSGREHLDAAAAEASDRRPELAATISALVPVLADPQLDVARRFEQTTGPVMAKGVEDTAFYRYTRLGSLTEVGGDPSVFSVSVDGFHAAQEARQAAWPRAMTTLSTHDTKRGEDVRARLDVLAEIPERWAEVVDGCRARATTGHGPFDALLLQAVVGSWPAARERLHAYAEKASREAAESTGWWDPDEAFEGRMHAMVDAVFDDPDLHDLLAGFVAEIAHDGWANSLSMKLLQLTAPGVPDVYQGSELWETSLVDPDNRRAVDFGERARLLTALDGGGEPPAVDETGAAKLLLVSRALRLRRDRPELFTRYTALETVGPASDHAIAFDRGGALTVATRLPVALRRRGGWGETLVRVPRAQWRDELTGRVFTGGEVLLDELLAVYPVALLRPVGERETTPAER